MALLRIPDKYAQERAVGLRIVLWNDVYTHTFSEEREKVDETIDHITCEDLLGVKSHKILTWRYYKTVEKADPDNWQSYRSFKTNFLLK